MGYSIVKQVSIYELSRIVGDYKVYVKSFSDTKRMLIEDYVQTTLREMPTYIILHVGPNYIPNKKVLTELLT